MAEEIATAIEKRADEQTRVFNPAITSLFAARMDAARIAREAARSEEASDDA